MTVPSVINGQVVDDEWGNAVAADVNDHESRLDALEALSLGTRMTAVEAAVVRQGIWWVRSGSQSIGASSTVVVTATATTEASAGWSVGSGIVTVPAGMDGVYSVFAKLTAAGGQGAWLTVDDSFDVPLLGGFDRSGAQMWAGTASLRLNAGQNVRAYIRNGTASAFNVSAANVHLWRVAS